jgi:hypothetical protein
MQFTSLALLGTAALPLVLGAYVGSLPEAPAVPALPTVTLVADDYSIASPDTLQAGAVTLRLVNQGKEFHHIWVGRLDGGKTVEDLLGAMKTPGPLPAWVRDMGGPNAPAPGGESNATVTLSPGSYFVACVIPSADGVPHLMKGMIRPLTVVKTAKPAANPVGDVTMALHDYSFTLSRPLTAGKHLIEVRNNGQQPHEIELVRLAPGKTAQEVLAWIHQPEGAPPGLPLGGVAPLGRGGVNWFEVDLEPGRYALICFLPDSKDGKPHFMHGMVQEIEVGSSLSAR